MRTCSRKPNGTTVRKHEPDLPRCYTNASAPEEPSDDADGVAVTSLNLAVRAEPPPNRLDGDKDPPGRAPKGPPEEKPEVLAKVHDIAILRVAAKAFKTDVYGFVTDWKDFFSQFCLAPEEMWKSVRHTAKAQGLSENDLDPDGNIGIFVTEYRLGFGVSSSSNVCQRFATALVQVFRKLFDEEEKKVLAAVTNAEQLKYLTARRALGPHQDRLYEISCYTDDPFACFVGADRLARALKLWHQLCDTIGMKPAIPRKRGCGVALRWLGLDFLLTEGVLVIPGNKRLRAIADLELIVNDDHMEFGDYRSIMGFLEHLRPFVLGLDKTLMYNMYGPFKATPAPLAGTRVKMTKTIKAQATRWLGVLRSTSGMRFASVLKPATPTPSLLTNHLYSDAALKGSGRPGIGGYMQGFYWSLQLHGDACELPISVLEFIAIAVNLMVFEPYVRDSDTVLATDSLNCVQVLNAGRAKSVLMQHVHVQFLALPEVKSMGAASLLRHYFGPANPCADAASRDKLAELHQFCAQLGVAPVRLEVPARAWDLIASTLLAAAALKAVEPKGQRSQADPVRVPPPQSRAARGAAHVEQMTQTGAERSHNVTGDGPRARGHGDEYTNYPLDEAPITPSIDRNGYRDGPSSRPVGLLAARGKAFMRRVSRFGAEYSSDVTSDGPLPARRVKHWSVPLKPLPRPFTPVKHAQPKAVALAPAVRVSAAAKRPSSVLQNIRQRAKKRAGALPPPRLPVTQQGSRRDGTVQHRAEELAYMILADSSPLALKPEDDSVIFELCRAALAAAEDSAAPATLVKDTLTWDRWGDYCASMNTPAFRSDLRANAGLNVIGAHRESLLLAGFMIHCASIIPSYGGKGHCKPQTAWDAVLAVKRIHKRLGAPIGVLPLVRSIFQGVVKKYVQLHGADALMPKRKEPLSDSIIASMLALPAGIKLGKQTLDWTSPFFIVFKAVLCTGFSSGMRKAEMAYAANENFDASRMSRASLSWIIKGKKVASPSMAQLLALNVGDYVGIKPGRAKNDPWALHFGWKPMWMPYADTATNAAKAIAAMLIAVPVPNHMAASVPLFSLNTEGAPIRHSTADSMLQYLLKAAMPDEDTTKWSMHSLRIGAACALMVAGASTDEIMALCRWRSPGSVLIYARLGPEVYGNWVLKAQAAKVDATTARNMPRTDYDGVFTMLNEGVALNWEEVP